MELDTSSIEKRFAFGFLQQLLRWMAEQAEGPSAEQLARYERAEAEAAWLLRESVIPPKVIEESILLKIFCSNSPLSLLANTLTKSVESSISKL